MKKSVFTVRLVLEMLLVSFSVYLFKLWEQNLSDSKFVISTLLMFGFISVVSYTAFHMYRTVRKFTKLSVVVGRIIISAIMTVGLSLLYNEAYELIHSNVAIGGLCTLLIFFVGFMFLAYYLVKTFESKSFEGKAIELL